MALATLMRLHTINSDNWFNSLTFLPSDNKFMVRKLWESIVIKLSDFSNASSLIKIKSDGPQYNFMLVLFVLFCITMIRDLYAFKAFWFFFSGRKKIPSPDCTTPSAKRSVDLLITFEMNFPSESENFLLEHSKCFSTF